LANAELAYNEQDDTLYYGKGGTPTAAATILAIAGPGGFPSKTYVDNADALRAPIASPIFTGVPQAPTPANADNSTILATTAFVKQQGYLTTIILTVGTTPIGAGTSGSYVFDNAGIIGEKTPTQLTADLNLFTAALKGVVPNSGGGTLNFLRADGSWVAPPTGGAATSIGVGSTSVSGGVSGNFLYDNAGVLGEQTPTQMTATLNVFTSTLKGVVPSSGGGTANYLRADGTWAAPPGGGVTPAALTAVNDSNVTLTLGGTPATALLQATSITVGWTGTLAPARFPALTGDVTNTAGTVATTIANGAVTNGKLANAPANSIKGNNTGIAAAPIDLTGTQVTAMLSAFTATLQGLAPASGGGTTSFLRADGSWATPAGGGGGASVTISATPPATPAVGDLWWDSVGGQLYIYYNDGTSTQWTIAVNPQTSGRGGAVTAATPPATPVAGDLWWDSVGGQIYIYYDDGTSKQWVAC
jgi:hypothetical protein